MQVKKVNTFVGTKPGFRKVQARFLLMTCSTYSWVSQSYYQSQKINATFAKISAK